MEAPHNSIHTVIEIGTENTKIIMGYADDDGTIEVLGSAICHSNMNEEDGQEQSRLNCIRKGEKKNLRFLSENLKRLFAEIENETGINITDTKICVGVTGSSLKVHEDNTSIQINGRNHVITAEDVMQVQNRAREGFQTTYTDGICIQTHTCYFKTDSHSMIFDAVGQASRKLTGFVQGVFLSREANDNLVYMVTHALGERVEYAPQQKVTPLYLPLCMSLAFFNPASLPESTLTIDIGAGVTSYAISMPDDFLCSGHIPVGCNHIENDLMQAFKIRWDTAQNLVRKLSTDFADEGVVGMPASVVNPDDKRARTAIVEKRAGRRNRIIPISSIEKVVALRLTEIFNMVQDAIHKKNYWGYVNGTIYLSGGGARIPGVEELASKVLKHPVEIGTISPLFKGDEARLSDPRFTVPLGLLRQAIGHEGIQWMAHNQTMADLIRQGRWKELVKLIFR